MKKPIPVDIFPMPPAGEAIRIVLGLGLLTLIGLALTVAVVLLFLSGAIAFIFCKLIPAILVGGFVLAYLNGVLLFLTSLFRKH